MYCDFRTCDEAAMDGDCRVPKTNVDLVQEVGKAYVLYQNSYSLYNLSIRESAVDLSYQNALGAFTPAAAFVVAPVHKSFASAMDAEVCKSSDEFLRDYPVSVLPVALLYRGGATYLWPPNTARKWMRQFPEAEGYGKQRGLVNLT